ncbi:uncharacterized protein LOC143291427 [Babylonia areolata]|uniref:uncharacterized protein LOC143291427 n=1 Tax=Babylonia areolata TaxID=304850 RepID=UPI003FD1D5EF
MHAEFGLTISLKKINIMGQDVSSTSCISNGDFTLEVVEDFTYLSSTTSSNLSLDADLNKRIGKAATAMARLAKRVLDNPILTDHQHQDAGVPSLCAVPQVPTTADCVRAPTRPLATQCTITEEPSGRRN